MPACQGSLKTLLPVVAGKIGRSACESIDWMQGALTVGQGAAFADRIELFAAIVECAGQQIEGCRNAICTWPRRTP